MAGNDKSKKKKDKEPGNTHKGEMPPFLQKQLEKIQKHKESQDLEDGEQVKEYWNERAVPEFPWLREEAETPLEKAQQLAYDAMDAPTRKESINLARQALKVSPDCADAYVILAEEYATSLGEALYYYRAGVAAGERAIGPKLFKSLAGEFWGDLRTRPYLRARAGLAECLWELGKQEESVRHYQEMLRLNPRDNQGIRYILASCLLKMDHWQELKQLLSRYHEDSAVWLYTQALVLYIEQGDSPEARRALQRAVKYNRYIIPYLTGQKKLPRQLPVFIGFGDRNEAIYYAAEFGASWMEVKGAINWLQQHYGRQQKKPSTKSQTSGVPQVFLQAFLTDDDTEF
jgi:tetratricopeptide (TPR) repeat protein